MGETRGGALNETVQSVETFYRGLSWCHLPVWVFDLLQLVAVLQHSFFYVVFQSPLDVLPFLSPVCRYQTDDQQFQFLFDRRDVYYNRPQISLIQLFGWEILSIILKLTSFVLGLIGQVMYVVVWFL